VLTRTADVHAAAWKEVFDRVLADEGSTPGFDPVGDYLHFVDGKLRADGVRSFLASRGITVPEGEASDPPSARTVAGIGAAKNLVFLKILERQGVAVFDGAVALVNALHQRGIPTAVVSASENTRAVLRAAGIADLFDVCVDGVVIGERHLAGKPAPDSYLEAARELGVDPGQAAMVEDALAGVEAGRAGRFGWVVAVDHADHAAELRDHGAGVVVTDLADLLPYVTG
jgi:HAD superfamily hydrolase (TIGR01509 family)